MQNEKEQWSTEHQLFLRLFSVYCMFTFPITPLLLQRMMLNIRLLVFIFVIVKSLEKTKPKNRLVHLEILYNFPNVCHSTLNPLVLTEDRILKNGSQIIYNILSVYNCQYVIYKRLSNLPKHMDN